MLKGFGRAGAMAAAATASSPCQHFTPVAAPAVLVYIGLVGTSSAVLPQARSSDPATYHHSHANQKAE
jgi:hypothetical protein